jgi:glycosyltransferase involved in cell wall biosynthesis
MKIIRLSALLDFGGIESKMANLSTFSDDNEWIFVAIGKGGTASQKIIKNKKAVICFHIPYKIPSVKTLYLIYQFLKKTKPDVVHTSGAEANFHGIIAAKLARIPVVVAEEIGISNQSKKAKLIFNYIYSLSNYIIAESEIVADHLRKNYNIDNKKLRVVPNFTLFPAIAIHKNQNTVYSILSVSRLEPVKNISGIINVLHRLKLQNYQFQYTIVGEGSARKVIETLIKKLKLEREITCVGYQENPIPFYLNSDLFILNSYSEGFSNALLEAMYYKKIVITAHVGAAKEVIQEGKNGFIVGIDNQEELYQKIKKVYHLSQERTENIQNNAHQSVIEKYTIESHVANLLPIYTSKK